MRREWDDYLKRTGMEKQKVSWWDLSTEKEAERYHKRIWKGREPMCRECHWTRRGLRYEREQR